MSGPVWTTTYQVPPAGGYVRFRVDLVSATPWASATTGFRAKAMPPRAWQLPRWMCETWVELAWRPLIISSSVVVRAAAVRLIVPVALTPGSGVSLKFSGVALAEADGAGEAVEVGDGEVDTDVPPPHAMEHRAIAASHVLAHVNPAQHRARALPQQVAVAGWEFSFIPARRFRVTRAWAAVRGAGAR